MRKAVTRPRGHNLLEMILATFIFSTVALGTTAVWIQHSRVMNKSGGRLVGQFLANELMEECLAAGYDSVDTLAITRPEIEMREIVRDAEKVTLYQPTITVADLSIPGPSGNLTPKLVTVRVEWDEQEGRGFVEYQSQLAEAGGDPSGAGGGP